MKGLSDRLHLIASKTLSLDRFRKSVGGDITDINQSVKENTLGLTRINDERFANVKSLHNDVKEIKGKLSCVESDLSVCKSSISSVSDSVSSVKSRVKTTDANIQEIQEQSQRKVDAAINGFAEEIGAQLVEVRKFVSEALISSESSPDSTPPIKITTKTPRPSDVSWSSVASESKESPSVPVAGNHSLSSKTLHDTPVKGRSLVDPKNSTMNKDSSKKSLTSSRHHGDHSVPVSPSPASSGKHITCKPQDPPSSSGFVAVVRNKTTRLFLCGMSASCTFNDIQSYLSERGVTATFIRIMKSKIKHSVSAQVNILSSDVGRTKSEKFWPNGLRVRKWYSKNQYYGESDESSNVNNDS